MAEGLFDPTTFPFSSTIQKSKLLKSIVKVRPKRKLKYDIFKTEDEASNWSKTVVDSNGFETFFVGMTEDETKLVNDANFSNRLFTHEFCELHKSGAVFPNEAWLKGTGSGFFISPTGHVVTNFHLVSGIVEAHGLLETGYRGPQPIRAPSISVEVLESYENGEWDYKVFDTVFLVATFSKKQAFGEKLDLAILKIDHDSSSHFLSMTNKSIKPFEKLYSVGFSMRTARSEKNKQLFGYNDANYSMRASVGLMVKDDGNSFLSDVDGAPGNSGSAAISEKGELVGVYMGSTGNGITSFAECGHRRHVYAHHIHTLLNKED